MTDVRDLFDIEPNTIFLCRNILIHFQELSAISTFKSHGVTSFPDWHKFIFATRCIYPNFSLKSRRRDCVSISDILHALNLDLWTIISHRIPFLVYFSNLVVAVGQTSKQTLSFIWRRERRPWRCCTLQIISVLSTLIHFAPVFIVSWQVTYNR